MAFVDQAVVEPKVTDQLVPAGRPVSVKFTGCRTWVQATGTVMEVALTVTVPLSTSARQPGTAERLKAKVPFGSSNVIVLDAALSTAPPRVTAQAAEGGSPVSTNQTGYVFGAQATEIETGAPETEIVPE